MNTKNNRNTSENVKIRSSK